MDALKQNNKLMRLELRVALSAKRKAQRASAAAKRDAQDRLEKWHHERFLRQSAEDEAAAKQKHARDLEQLISKYKDKLAEK